MTLTDFDMWWLMWNLTHALQLFDKVNDRDLKVMKLSRDIVSFYRIQKALISCQYSTILRYKKQDYKTNYAKGKLTIYIKPCRVLVISGTVVNGTGINTPILHCYSTYINVADHITVNRNVLANEEPEITSYSY